MLIIGFLILTLRSDLFFGFYMELDISKTNFNVSAMGSAVVRLDFTALLRNTDSGLFVCDPISYYDKCDPLLWASIFIYGDIRYNRDPRYDHYRDLFDKWCTNTYRRRDTKKEMFAQNITAEYITFDQEDNNKIYLDTVYYQTQTYLRIMDGCIYILDEDIFYITEFIMKFPFHAFANSKGWSSDYYRYEEYTNSHGYITLSSYCSNNYYMLTCWIRCVDVPSRYTCFGEGEQKCLSYWQPTPILYRYDIPDDYFKNWRSYELIRFQCIFFNRCMYRAQITNEVCRIDGDLCFPLTNSSYTCLKFHHRYHLSNNMEANFTFTSLLDNEYLLLTFTLSGPEQFEVYSRSYCHWIIAGDIGSSVTNFDVLTNVSILQMKSTIQFGYYPINVYCELGQFQVFVFYRTIYVQIAPKNYMLVNVTASNGLYIYIGQTITCLNDAVPQNLGKYGLYLLTHNFRVLPNRTNQAVIFIPVSANIGFCRFNCTFLFRFRDKRPPVEMFERININLRSYIHFYWLRRFKNVYYIDEFAGCIYSAYFTGKVYIKIMSGVDNVNTFPASNFSTFVTIGGSFMFICTLTIKHSFNAYYKPHSFDIFHAPTYICMLLHHPYPGAFLQCGSNGYPRDQLHYTLQLGQAIHTKVSSINYIQIPYNTDLTKLPFTCHVSFSDRGNVRELELNMMIEIKDNLSAVLQFDDRDAACYKYVSLPIDNAIELSKDRLQFDAYVFSLHLRIPLEMLIYINIFNLCIAATIVLLVSYRKDCQKSSIDNSLITIRRRAFHDKLLGYQATAVSVWDDRTDQLLSRLQMLSTRMS